MLRNFITKLQGAIGAPSDPPSKPNDAPQVTISNSFEPRPAAFIQPDPERSFSISATEKAFEKISSAEDWLSAGKDIHVPSDLLHPDKQGLEPVSAKELMDANRLMIEQALQTFTHKQHIKDFDTHILEMVRRFAHWMGPFPASRGHHHAHRGGLFTHSIGVAVTALHMSVSKNVVTASSPRDRDTDLLAWQMVCFISGLLHDIGKLNTTGKIFALSVIPDQTTEGRFKSSSAPVYAQPWEPMVEGFEGWVKAHRVRSYYIDFDMAETLPHRDFTVRYVMALIPRPLLAFIYNANEVVRQQFEDFIRNPESPAKTPVFQVVQDADHLNVAQSIDPRRSPGTVEMTSLVIRRFNEFASEARWNLPTSPLIYAHVQKRTDDGIRYYGVPFFVATEQSINEFVAYLKSRPLLGVSFGERINELVFNCLESAFIMNRTLSGLLPNQIPVEDLNSYVPASRATVRFRAREIDSVIRPVMGEPDDAIFELPVIPIKVRIPSSGGFTAPTLSFTGTPSSQAAAVIPVAIEAGKISPSDPTLRNDPEFMARLTQGVEQLEITGVEAEAVAGLVKAKKGTANQSKTQTDKQKSVLKKLSMRSMQEETPQKAFDLAAGEDPTPGQGQGQGQGYNEEPANDSKAGPILTQVTQSDTDDTNKPIWLRFHNGLTEKLEDVEPHAIWAVVWLYAWETKYELVKATRTGKGGYALRASMIPKNLRENICNEIKSDGGSIALFARHWEVKGRILPSDPQFAKHFKVSQIEGTTAFTIELDTYLEGLLSEYWPQMSVSEDPVVPNAEV